MLASINDATASRHDNMTDQQTKHRGWHGRPAAFLIQSFLSNTLLYNVIAYYCGLRLKVLSL